MYQLWNKVGRTYGIPEISNLSDMELFFAITMKKKITYLYSQLMIPISGRERRDTGYQENF